MLEVEASFIYFFTYYILRSIDNEAIYRYTGIGNLERRLKILIKVNLDVSYSLIKVHVYGGTYFSLERTSMCNLFPCACLK